MNPYHKQNLIRSLENALESLKATPAKQECKTCEHYQINVCTLVDVVPPKHVLEAGCEKYKLDDIPF